MSPLEKIDRSLLEAGQDLGESKFTTFLRVTLPLAMPGVIASVVTIRSCSRASWLSTAPPSP